MGSFRGRATLHIADIRAPVEVDLWSAVDHWSGLTDWCGTFLTSDHASLLSLLDTHRTRDDLPLKIQLVGDDDRAQVIITQSNGWDGELQGTGVPPTRLRSQ